MYFPAEKTRTITPPVEAPPPEEEVTNEPVSFGETQLTGDKGFKVAEGESLTVELPVINPDEDPITLRFVGEVPEGMVLDLDNLNVSYEPGYKAAGVYQIVIEAMDDKQEVPAKITLEITVSNTDVAPQFRQATVQFKVNEGEATSFALDIFNPDEDPYELSLVGEQTLVFLEGEELTFSPSYTDQGSYEVKVAVKDLGTGTVSEGTVSYEVVDVNLATTFEFAGDLVRNFDAGSKISIPLKIINPDLDDISIATFPNNLGIKYEANKQVLTWDEPPFAVGNYRIGVLVDEGKGLDATPVTFDINFHPFVKFEKEEDSFVINKRAGGNVTLKLENPFQAEEFTAEVLSPQGVTLTKSKEEIKVTFPESLTDGVELVVQIGTPQQINPSVHRSTVTIGGVRYLVYADQGDRNTPFDSPWGTDYSPFTSEAVAEDPYDSFIEQNNPVVWNGPTQRNEPWIEEGVTTTDGNNVVAYLDLGGGRGFQDETDIMGKMTGNNEFIYPYDSSLPPQAEVNQQAAVVNLFYVINYLHDWFKDFGFDEASGNAQKLNFGRGGEEGDPLLAEGQDFSGKNNANMSTPGDGASPVMQMYLFENATRRLTLSINDSDFVPFAYSIASYGADVFDLEGEAVYVEDLAGTGEGCEDIQNPDALAGKIAIFNRGTCTFVTKSYAAQQAGAIATVIVNNVPESGAQNMPSDGSPESFEITIPTISLSFEQGEVLAAAENTAFSLYSFKKKDLDGTMENTIIAHEWGHYITNRLIGNGRGLYNNQGRSMGEGWGDFMGLFLVVKAEDALVAGNERFQGSYSMGSFAVLDNFFGIRRAPYSTDTEINPLTFRYIEQGVPLPEGQYRFGADGSRNSEVHASGEIWANMLWEIYASFLNDPRYTFQEAQDRMGQILVDSLKLTPPLPTYVEARNAVIAAASDNYEDMVLIGKAFSKRGMGPNAIAPEKESEDHTGVVEDFSPFEFSDNGGES